MVECNNLLGYSVEKHGLKSVKAPIYMKYGQHIEFPPVTLDRL